MQPHAPATCSIATPSLGEVLGLLENLVGVHPG
jgi:hypothetical protein